MRGGLKQSPKGKEAKWAERGSYLCALSLLQFYQSHDGSNTLHIDSKFRADNAGTLLLFNDAVINLIP